MSIYIIPTLKNLSIVNSHGFIYSCIYKWKYEFRFSQILIQTWNIEWKLKMSGGLKKNCP